MKVLFTLLFSIFLMSASDDYYTKIRGTLVSVDSKVGGFGSGVVVKSDGQGSFIVTDKHVCLTEKIPILKPLQADPIMEYGLFIISKIDNYELRGIGQVMKVAPSMDLCLIYTNIPNLPVAKLAKQDLKVGDKLFSYKYPFNENTRTSSTFDGYTTIEHSIFQKQHLGSQPGSSGSGVFNESGELVGVVVGYICSTPKCTPEQQDFSFSTPLEFIKFFLHEVL